MPCIDAITEELSYSLVLLGGYFLTGYRTFTGQRIVSPWSHFWKSPKVT